MGIKKAPEEQFMVQLTWKCNLNCPGCTYEKMLGARHIPIKTIKKVAPAITRYHEVVLAGGEPTLHPNFWQIVSMIAKRRPSYVAIITNGYSFTGSNASVKGFFSRLGRIAKETGVELAVSVSVDDYHVDRSRRRGSAMKERVNDLRERVRRIRKNEPAGGKVSVGFCAAAAPGQSGKRILKKYGLPEDTYIAKWSSEAQGGSVRKMVVTPESRVFPHERAMLEGRPIGDLKKHTMQRIIRRMHAK